MSKAIEKVKQFKQFNEDAERDMQAARQLERDFNAAMMPHLQAGLSFAQASQEVCKATPAYRRQADLATMMHRPATIQELLTISGMSAEMANKLHGQSLNLEMARAIFAARSETRQVALLAEQRRLTTELNQANQTLASILDAEPESRTPAKDAFFALVNAAAGNGQGRTSAINQVIRERPELHRAFITEQRQTVE